MSKNKQLKNLIESMLFVADSPLSIKAIQTTLEDDLALSKKQLQEILSELKQDYADRGIHLVEVASGFRFQAANEHADQIALLWKEKAPRYSRAMLETLALIAYRQPITRGEIEDIRGVSVSSYIIKTLQERNWVKVVGHKEVPGRPALLATTDEFLDYFSLKSLAELPELMPVSEINLNIEQVEEQLETAEA
ncbi:SMC-Scp complex subunit ScpB [Thalassotalea mangrovi]|uniref:SMC-Scp complex subunit ScpB n=1 Tax=Thalassotalea mangrovi TaxID=2572245 RepID=A0A4V5NWQ0_9GAMM|nr:SMC-Scp complex subunit ScpB [Thalassotalea mangrovi]TKB45145.1 SMC-Scp complex subunit ScpB [Thalassotalea mangrovi]